jgi:copper homeostasis protein
MDVVVEICVQGIESALAAQAGGADRVELCEDLAVGGVTPGAGAIAVACRRLIVPVHVLIRPRGGNFIYTEAEFEVMRHDIQVARSLGAAGVVIGLLDPAQAIDRERTARLIEAAHPLSITFHKAFDHTADSIEALDDLIGLGVERVLTSGGMAKAVDGLDRLVALNRRAAGRVIIMAGGRITETDTPTLTNAGLREIHVGSAACTEGRTDAERVARIVTAAGGRRRVAG